MGMRTDNGGKGSFEGVSSGGGKGDIDDSASTGGTTRTAIAFWNGAVLVDSIESNSSRVSRRSIV
jgi:hypothetical protein